jgi:hypothetical protein
MSMKISLMEGGRALNQSGSNGFTKSRSSATNASSALSQLARMFDSVFILFFLSIPIYYVLIALFAWKY